MFKNEHKKKNKGFTLIEMLIAVLILGILVAIGVPTYLRAVEKSRTSDPINTLKSIAKAEQVEKLRKGLYTNQAQELDLELRDYPDGNIVSGDAFEGKFFDYKIYGEDKSATTATRRSTKEEDIYTLSIDYGTGELFCSPATNKTCIDLKLEEGQDFTSQSNNNNTQEEEIPTCSIIEAYGRTYQECEYSNRTVSTERWCNNGLPYRAGYPSYYHNYFNVQANSGECGEGEFIENDDGTRTYIDKYCTATGSGNNAECVPNSYHGSYKTEYDPSTNIYTYSRCKSGTLNTSDGNCFMEEGFQTGYGHRECATNDPETGRCIVWNDWYNPDD